MFLKKATLKSNMILISSFLIMFFYYLNYPLVSAKGVVMDLGVESVLKNTYMMWGVLNDYIYSFFNYFFGSFMSDMNLWQLMMALQVSALWSLTMSKIIIHSSIFSFLVFFNPFILNYFTLCTSDSMVLSLMFLIGFKGWDKMSLLSALVISFMHMGLLPMYITSFFAFLCSSKTKKFFIMTSLTSMISSILIYLLLRHTDVISLLPKGTYRLALEYPSFVLTNKTEVKGMLQLAYNAAGSFNFKILSFGFIGQMFCMAFKNKFPKNTFSLCFSSFFICSILSSVPNANSYIYHPILIAFPFLMSFSLNFLKINLSKFYT